MANTAREFDCLIFGGGLAGSVLAWTFLKKEKRPLVIDSPLKSNCSRVAAGLINPIGGKRLNLVWEADVHIPFAIDFYRQLENRFERTLLEERPIARLFANSGEQSLWNEKRSDAGYANWTAALRKVDLRPLDLLADRTGFAIEGGSVLDVPKTIQLIREALGKENLIAESDFKYQDIEVQQQAIRWNGNAAPIAVFAEGHLATGNPWFSFIPYRPAKGVIGRISTDIQLTDTVVIEGNFLIPKGPDSALVGATYAWDDRSDSPDQKGIHELETFLGKHLGDRWKWIEVNAGVRPSIPGAKPAVGPHPEISHLFSFNGFGSKGATQTPILAEALREHIWNATPLPIDILPARFLKETNPLPKRWIAVEIARDRVLQHVKAGDAVADATVGNGHDTLWLAKRVGPRGRVHAFDLQSSAIESAKRRIEPEGALPQTVFYNACHSTLSRQLPQDELLSAAVFNLGYLPKGDKLIVTRLDTTIPALNQALSFLKAGGILSIVIYPEHEGGGLESKGVLNWSRSLDSKLFQTEIVSNPSGNPASPYLVFVERTG